MLDTFSSIVHPVILQVLTNILIPPPPWSSATLGNTLLPSTQTPVPVRVSVEIDLVAVVVYQPYTKNQNSLRLS